MRDGKHIRRQRLPRLSDAEIVAIERNMHDMLFVFAARNPRFSLRGGERTTGQLHG